MSVHISKLSRSCHSRLVVPKKSALDVFDDHVRTCTAHSGAKKAHDWVVDQIADLFRTTHRVKTQQVTRNGVSDVGTLN